MAWKTEDIEATYKQMKFGSDVLFTGRISDEDLASVLGSALALTYIPYLEGFGIPIIEALYSKTPVISNKFGVFPEAGGDHSVYIDPNSISEMQAAILDLWQNEDKRKMISEKGLDFVQKFNDANLAKNWETLYLNTCKQ